MSNHFQFQLQKLKNTVIRVCKRKISKIPEIFHFQKIHKIIIFSDPKISGPLDEALHEDIPQKGDKVVRDFAGRKRSNCSVYGAGRNLGFFFEKTEFTDNFNLSKFESSF